MIATRNQPRILLYHRFCESPDPEPTVIDAITFDWQIRHIQRNFRVITLGEYVRGVREKTQIPRPTAILTVDDGYRDFYEIAYPILRKHRVPATFFITVNFIGPLSDFCIRLDDEKKWVFIYRLLAAARVDLPREAISKYAPVTWEQINEMNGQGIEIGSHTLNHPILSRVRDERLLREEIEGSRKAIEERIGERVKTFCYPNGTPGDIDERAMREVKKAGYHGAVVTTGGFFDDNYRLPRIGVSSDKTDFLWKACGLENLTGQFRFN